MANLLTTKDVQALIKVDKSTIYRMAEAGRIPAIKVGRQWRFPEDRLQQWLGEQSAAPVQEAEETMAAPAVTDGLAGLLPPNTIEALAQLLGEVLGAMVILTDMEGQPLTAVANPCGMFEAVESVSGTLERCTNGWRDLAGEADLTPRFVPTHLGFLCARGFIRVGSELRGMVIVGGVAPEEWPPPPERIEAMAAELGMAVDDLSSHIDEVYHLDTDQRDSIVALIPRVGTLISHLANERGHLVTKLDAIASLAGMAPQRSET